MKIISYGSIYVFVPQDEADVNHLVSEVQRLTPGGVAGAYLGGDQGKFLDLIAQQPQLVASPVLYEFAASGAAT